MRQHFSTLIIAAIYLVIIYVLIIEFMEPETCTSSAWIQLCGLQNLILGMFFLLNYVIWGVIVTAIYFFRRVRKKTVSPILNATLLIIIFFLASVYILSGGRDGGYPYAESTIKTKLQMRWFTLKQNVSYIVSKTYNNGAIPFDLQP